jgi:phosphoribosyl 1,2-cyclic phosphodiesterase
MKEDKKAGLWESSPLIRLTFWGVIGSAPVSCAGPREYGSHTICTSFKTESDELIVIDAGTGIIRLGDSIAAGSTPPPSRIHLLFTHFHLDHILGLPFFKPLFATGIPITFYSPWSRAETRATLGEMMAGRRYPIDFEDTPSAKEFRQLPENSQKIAGARLSWCPLRHPQASVAYRLQYGDQDIVLATDTEHLEDHIDERLLNFCRETDLLVYDSTFTPEEYSDKKGWGHSTWQEGTRLASEAGVRGLILSHLNPEHPDALLNAIQAQARKNFPRTRIAREICLNTEPQGS